MSLGIILELNGGVSTNVAVTPTDPSHFTSTVTVTLTRGAGKICTPENDWELTACALTLTLNSFGFTAIYLGGACDARLTYGGLFHGGFTKYWPLTLSNDKVSPWGINP